MKRLLITGATGNIGVEVIQFLFAIGAKNQIVAGVRDVEKAKRRFKEFPQLDYAYFDFENSGSFDKALDNIDCVFLLRPPHLSDIEKYFRPLISKIREKGIAQIVFLSVQGAEKSSIIPHNKIEKLIIDFGLEYIFLRPSYFMQNLTTTLLDDIQKKRKIILPAGSAKFNWIDVENIGETTAHLLEDFSDYKNQIIELTGDENLNFHEAANLINTNTQCKIEYLNVNPFRYYRIKRKDNIPKGLIFVMIFLHFLPRFQKAPKISSFYEELTSKKPTSLKDFIKREQHAFTSI